MRRIVSLTLLLLPATALAQANYHPHPLGIRTAGMGGAAAAFGTDSAMPLVNPAGLAMSHGYWLALTANMVAFNRFDVDDYYTLDTELDLGNEPAVLSGGGLDIFPSSLVIGFPVDGEGRHMVAFSAVMPYGATVGSTLDLLIDPIPELNLTLLDERDTRTLFYHVGPSYAFRLDDKIRIGASAFVRFVQFDFDSSYETSSYDLETGDVTFGPSEVRFRASSRDLVLVAGVQVGPFEGFSAGLTIRSPTIYLGGSSRQDNRNFDSSSTVDQGVRSNLVAVDQVTFEGTDWRSPTPLSFTLGLGYEVPRTFALALDVNFFLPVGTHTYNEGFMDRLTLVDGFPASIQRQDYAFEAEKSGVVNVNIGAEVALSERILLRGGFYTDFSNRPLPEERTIGDVGLAAIDRFGATLGLAYAADAASLQLGAIYRRDVGDQIGVEFANEPSYPDRNLSGDALMLAFSGELDASTLLGLANAVAKGDERGALAKLGATSAAPVAAKPVAAKPVTAPPPPPPPVVAPPPPVVTPPPPPPVLPPPLPVATATRAAKPLPPIGSGAQWVWGTSTVAVTIAGAPSAAVAEGLLFGIRSTFDIAAPGSSPADFTALAQVKDPGEAAKRGRAAGLGYVLAISISKPGPETLMVSRLIDCATGRVEMELEGSYPDPGPNPVERGRAVATVALAKLRQLRPR